MIDPEKYIQFIYTNASVYAQAKADRIYIENFLRSKKAMLMAQSTATAFNAKEVEAYASPEYVALLEGLKQAVEREETLRYQIAAAELKIDVWRTNEASNRRLDRAAQ